MIVKCINNNNDGRLTIDKTYIVNKKHKGSHLMSLVGMGGTYKIDRFVKLDDSEININEYIENYHYNINYKTDEDFLNELKWVKLKPSSKLKSLRKDIFYKIHRMNKYTSILNVGLKNEVIRRYRHKHYWGQIIYYSYENFIFFTDDDYKVIKRNEKIKKIKQKNKKTP